MEITDKALDTIDLGFVENIMLTGDENYSVIVSPIMLFGIPLLVVLLLYMYFDRGNRYSYFHSNSSMYGAIMIVGAFIYFVMPSFTHLWLDNLDKYNKDIGPIVAKIKIDELNAEQNLTSKLNAMIDFTDKSGKIYYVEEPQHQEKKQKHFYVGKNLQKTYADTLKQLENEYSQTQNLETAAYLKKVFLSGNQFIFPNKKKANYYARILQKEKDRQDALERKRLKDAEIKPIEKVKV